MVNTLIETTNVLGEQQQHLCQNGTQLSGGSGKTVRGTAISRREELSGQHERRAVRPEVLEEVGESVKEGERPLVHGRDLVVAEPHDDEDGGQSAEPHELDGLATPRVDERKGEPVARDQSRNGQTKCIEVIRVTLLSGMGHVELGSHDVTDRGVVHVVKRSLVRILRFRISETNGMEDDGWVEAQAVEGEIQSEPTVRAAYQGREVGPLREVGDKVPP